MCIESSLPKAKRKRYLILIDLQFLKFIYYRYTCIKIKLVASCFYYG